MKLLPKSIVVRAAFPPAGCASVAVPATKAPYNPASASAAEKPFVSEPPGDIYTCVMDPQIAEPKPDKCPICGMEGS